MFLGIEFGRVGECIWRIGRTDDWVRSRFGLAVLAEGILARAYARSRTRNFVFLLSQVSQRVGLNILHYFKNDVSFCRK